ncbi:SCA7, zinc-binding domain-containing protein, partial [Chytriomyces sp. MP71]
MTTAVLSADQVATVRCRVCAKPLLQSALVAHIENCRRIHPSHPLYEALNAADPITETVAAPVVPPQPAPPQFAHNNPAKERDKKEKRDRKRKRDKADVTTPSAEGISPMVGLTSGSSSVAGTPALLQQNNTIPAGTQPLTLPTAPTTAIQPLVPSALPKDPKFKGSRAPKDLSGASSKDSKSKSEKPAKIATIDYDKQCGVITDDGNPCARSITCKMHLMHMKRSVQGRSQPFDTLVSEY